MIVLVLQMEWVDLVDDSVVALMREICEIFFRNFLADDSADHLEEEWMWAKILKLE